LYEAEPQGLPVVCWRCAPHYEPDGLGVAGELMLYDREQWADDHGYMRYRCPKHGPFWSDSGPHCEQCGDPEPEEEETEADND